MECKIIKPMPTLGYIRVPFRHKGANMNDWWKIGHSSCDSLYCSHSKQI